ICFGARDLKGYVRTVRERQDAQIRPGDSRIREERAPRAARDLEGVVVHWKRHLLVRRPQRRAVGIDGLDIAGEPDEPGATDVAIRTAVRADLRMEGRASDRLRARSQAVVEVPPQLVPYDDKNDGRREDDRQRYRRGGDGREPGAEAEVVEPAHGSRSA